MVHAPDADETEAVMTHVRTAPFSFAEKYRKLVIEVKGDHARCTCNGEELEAAYEVPATGPIGVEGDRGQMEYRNLRLKELK